MRYRNQLLLMLLVSITIFLPLNANAGDGDSSNKVKNNEGRFKIFIAEHNIIMKGKISSIKSIFKMDKETGIVWRYRQGFDSKGKMYVEFFEVPNQ